MKRVLIVEDDVGLCLSLSDLLNEFGFETGVAGDGLKALEILDSADPLPDVILLDLRMPNMDGWTLREKLNAHSKYKSIPIIVMSADEAYAKVEAQAHFHKPFEISSMLNMLRQFSN